MTINYERRKLRARNNIAKNNKTSRPRIVIFRSNKNTYAQLVDFKGKTLKSFSTLNFKEKIGENGVESAKIAGEEFAKICLKAGFKEVVFDKGAYVYNGRVKALAQACREVGLKF